MPILAAEVSIHRLGTIGVGMLALFVFLICTEHLFSIPVLSLVWMAVRHDVGWQVVEEVC